ncbi:hypothetical protein WN990_17620 [Kitasatospora purpeofusca]|uniref:hypothetical protein n=1 Tax=Kitasatospora purpeofusca TaxID=67352 RepID=UPI0030F0F323
MSEEEDAIGDLEGSGALDAIRWAGESAYGRLLEDYDPATGHDQGWIGYTAHKLLKDRLHRVFSCGPYVVGAGQADAGMDVVAGGLGDSYFSMPRVSAELASVSDLNGSPGWQSGEWRWLLTSYPHGSVDKIHWQQKSPTKRKVAAQRSPDVPMLPFEEMEMFADISFPTEGPELDAEAVMARTLVLAHSVHPEFRVREFFVGRPRMNKGGGVAWWWKYDLLKNSPGFGSYAPVTTQPAPLAPTPHVVPDAPVRRRIQPMEAPTRDTIG